MLESSSVLLIPLKSSESRVLPTGQDSSEAADQPYFDFDNWSRVSFEL